MAEKRLVPPPPPVDQSAPPPTLEDADTALQQQTQQAPPTLEDADAAMQSQPQSQTITQVPPPSVLPPQAQATANANAMAGVPNPVGGRATMQAQTQQPQVKVRDEIKLPTAPAQAPDPAHQWLQSLEGHPLVGHVVKGVEEELGRIGDAITAPIKNAGTAMREGGEQPASQNAMALAGGATKGAVATVEDPFALGADIARYTPPAMLSQILQGKPPIMPSYNQVMGGQPLQERVTQIGPKGQQISDIMKKSPGMAATGELGGSLLALVGTVGVAAEKIGAKIAQRALGRWGAAHPKFLNIIRQAATGAVAMPTHTAGSELAHGQQVDPRALAESAVQGAVTAPIAEPMTKGLLKAGGAAGKATGKVTGRLLTNLKKTAPESGLPEPPGAEAYSTPEERLSQAQSQIKQDYPKVEQPPKPKVKMDLGLAKKGLQPETPQTDTVEAPKPKLQGAISKDVEAQKLPSADVAAKYGKAPITEPIKPAPETQNRFDWKMSQPADKYATQDASGKWKGSIDPNQKEPFLVKSKDSGHIYMSVNHPEGAGKITLGEQLSNKPHSMRGREGVAEDIRKASERMRQGTSESQMEYARQKGTMTSEQVATREEQTPKVEAGEVPKEQEELHRRYRDDAVKDYAESDQTTEDRNKAVNTIKQSAEESPGKPRTTLYANPIHELAKDMFSTVKGEVKKISDLFGEQHQAGREQIGRDVRDLVTREGTHDVIGRYAPELEDSLAQNESDRALALSKNDEEGAEFLRQDSIRQIDKHLDDEGDMNPLLESELKDYRSQLVSPKSLDKSTGLSRIINKGREGLVGGLFKVNPAFSVLQAYHVLELSPTVGGIKNVLAAYKALRNPAIDRMMDKYPLVKSVFADKPDYGSGSVTELNNKVFALSQAINDHGLPAIEKMAEGTQDFAKEREISRSFWNGLQNGSGGEASEFGRSYIGRNPSSKIALAWPAYRSGVTRVWAQSIRQAASSNPEIRSAALKRLAGLTLTRALLGGAPMAIEAQGFVEDQMAKYAPDLYLDMKNALHLMNLPHWAGMDISGHVTGSAMPFGNVTENLVRSVMPAIKKGDYTKVAETIMPMLGATGGLVSREMKAGGKVVQGTEPVSVYSEGIMGKKITEVQRKYNALNNVRDLIAPGADWEKSDIIGKHRSMQHLQNAGNLTPERQARLEGIFNFAKGE